VSHCDPEMLALRAVGETTGTAADDQHLASCVSCQTELDQLRAVVGTARAVTVQDVPVAPPPSVWAGITADLNLSPSLPSTEVTDGSSASGAQGTVIPFPGRARRVAWSVGLAAAAVGVLAGVIGATLLSGGSAQAPVATGTVLGSTVLAPVNPAVPGMAGDAVLTRTGSTDELAVAVTGVPPAARKQGFLEVWLLDPATGHMVSLGALDSRDHGTFVVPPGVDPATYGTVDVSLEPFDGNPGHSSNSMLRAALNA